MGLNSFFFFVLLKLFTYCLHLRFLVQKEPELDRFFFLPGGR